MLRIPDDIFQRVVEGYFDNPDRLDKRTAAFFRAMAEYSPEEVQETSRKVGIEDKELYEGNSVAALKFLTENPEPDKLVQEFFNNPLTKLRLSLSSRLPEETVRAFEELGMGYLLGHVQSMDVLYSSPLLFKATRDVLSLYGYIMAENYLMAVQEEYPGGPVKLSERFHDFSDMGYGNVELPFNDFEVHHIFSRGMEEMHLTMHHRGLADLVEGNYHARTLIGSSLLLESLPVIDVMEVRRRFSSQKDLVPRDPLALAFEAGYTIKAENGSYVYHLKNLLNALTEKVSVPEHRYFFLKALGFTEGVTKGQDLKNILEYESRELLKLETGKLFPSHDPDEPAKIQRVSLGYLGEVYVDVSVFIPVLNNTNSKRLAGIKSLSNIYNTRLGFASQSRLEHSIGVMHITTVMCNRFGITGYDCLKAQTYALVHDWGHIAGSHATEAYFNAESGFDHEKFTDALIMDNKECFKDLVDVEDLINMVNHKDPLHNVIGGPFGSDRIYYSLVDPYMCSEELNFNPLKLLDCIFWDGKQVVVNNPAAARDFLENRAILYENLYLCPSTQVSDAYLRKLLSAAGIKSPFDKLIIKNNPDLQILPVEEEVEFWEITDTFFHYFFINHPDREVSDPMRHLVLVYFKSPHATVAVLKSEGYELSEPDTEIPIYPEMIIGTVKPHIHGIDREELSYYSDGLSLPHNVDSLEGIISAKTGIPKRHIIVTLIPYLNKMSSEYAPVLKDGKVVSLFEDESIKIAFSERAERLHSIRVAVHPQTYPRAYNFFAENSFYGLVKGTFSQ